MQRVLLKPWQVLVGENLEPKFDAYVEVGSGSIEAITTDVPEGEVIDLGAMTLVPGFIDSHVHIGFAEPSAVLNGGVTTVRDLGWPVESILPLAERSREPGFAGPSILAAGPMLTAPGGYPTRARWAPPGTAREVHSADDARAAVRERVAEGAAVVKVALNPPVGPTLSSETLTAICDEAHAHALPVTGHIHGLGELEKALDAGIDELAHMLMSPETIPDETIVRMVERGVVVVPTLSIQRGKTKRMAMMNLGAFAEAGGRVVYGTDLGNAGPKPGIDRTEIDRMMRSGMDDRAIVAAGTTEAASWLGLTDRGSIAPGKRADLIAVAGDPLDAAIALTDVRFVMRAGRVVRGGR